MSGEGEFKTTGTGEVYNKYWMKYRSEIKEARIKVKGVNTLECLLGGKEYIDGDGYHYDPGCENIKKVDFTGSDLSKVRSCRNTFLFCAKLETVIMENMNMNSVTNATSMFAGCNKLKNIKTNGTTMNNLTECVCMFSNCHKLEILDLSFMEMKNIKDWFDCRDMFYYCFSLEKLITPKNTGKFTVDFDVIMIDSKGKIHNELPKNQKKSITLKAFVSKTDILSVTSGADRACIKWKTDSRVDGYYIYRRDKGKYKKIADIDENEINSYEDKSIKKGVEYEYKVESYIETYRGIYSEGAKHSKKICILATPKVKTQCTTKGINISWNKIKGAKSYKIYRGAANKSFSLIGTVKSNKYKSTDTKAKKEKCIIT